MRIRFVLLYQHCLLFSLTVLRFCWRIFVSAVLKFLTSYQSETPRRVLCTVYVQEIVSLFSLCQQYRIVTDLTAF